MSLHSSVKRLGRSSLALLSLCAVACGPRLLPAQAKSAEVRQFVLRHRAGLEAELGGANGETLHALATLAECQDVPGVGRVLRRELDEVFASTDNEAVAEHLMATLASERQLRCTGISGANLAGRRQVVDSARGARPAQREAERVNLGD